MPEGCGCVWHPKRARKWAHCRRCGTTEGAPDSISYRGLCLDCAITRRSESMIQLAQASGPHYDHWREAWLNAAIRVSNEA